VSTGPTAALTIDLSALNDGMAPGLSPARGAAMAEAASVCLTERQHASPCALTVDGSHSASLSLRFSQTGEAATASWGDAEEATQQGAYGVAILVMRHLEDLTVIERSWKGTHFDWWLGKIDSGPLFQNKIHLEVSGIRQGDERIINARVASKVKRFGVAAAPPASDVRRVVVVEYSRPLARMRQP
jgi:hypothetical protein